MSEAEHNIYRDGRVHVLSQECSTCIFRPHTRPVPGSRVAEMVAATKDDPGATVVCHHTLDIQPQANAICRGWFDRLGDADPILRLARIMGMLVEQEETA